ncbi:MAG: hypothetical protein ACYC0V_10650 [Armatimonadota bacterium]
MNYLVIKTVIALSLVSTISASAAGEFKTLCDFDNISCAWTDESRGTTTVKLTNKISHSGKSSLAVDVRRTGNVLRATWGFDLYDIKLTPETRLRFFIHGSPLLKTSPSQPHGSILLIESGGGPNGADSHWAIDLHESLYSGNKWQEFTTTSLKDAHSPGWNPDADGKIDVDNVYRVLFVMQMEDPSGKQKPFTFHLDDLSATNWETRTPQVSLAANSSTTASVRPVQRGFVGRKREAGQTITFTDMTGWKVVKYGGIEAEFVRSEEEPLFGEAVGKLTFRAAGSAGMARLEPPKPIELTEFNGILMWVFGPEFSFHPRVTYPFTQISLELVDRNGEIHNIGMDQLDWKFWSLMHKCVRVNTATDERHTAQGGDRDTKIQWPARLTAIEIRGCHKDNRTIYFDSIIFRKEKPNLPKFNADLSKLPFPTTKDTILPSVSDAPVENRLAKESSSYRFTAKSASETITYLYTPRTGTLSDLKVKTDKGSFIPCTDGGLLSSGRQLTARLTASKMLNNAALLTQWRASNGIDYELTLSIKGKSMICDWRSDDVRITELSLGHASMLKDYKLFNVPYLTMGIGAYPAILWNEGAYCFTMLDWYNTNASEFYPRSERLTDSTALYNCGARYLNLTDGSRNRLRERQFITVSSRFEDVLPNIPNPPSPMAKVTGKNLYCHVGGVGLDRFKNWLSWWKLYKEYGIDHVRLSQHEDGWSDGEQVGQGPQEFTMTLDASPEIGDAEVIEYCREVKKLGWLIGLYSNYTDYSMLGKSWDERNVTKAPNGEWRRVWPPCFNIKPLKAADMEAYFAPRIAEKFGTNTVYCDVHTCVTPWYNVDYEAGTPGAGMLSTTFKAYGALMMNERKAYGGPVFSEGTSHWFYAGLNDGNYAQMGLPQPSTQPLLLDFDLRKIHPLQANVAMATGWEWDKGFYHMMATQIAYGHIGFLPVGGDNVSFVASGYYLMQQLQERYTQIPVEKILYRTANGKMLEISDALPVGANLENQVYIKYENGLEVYVNRNDTKHWKLNIDGFDIDLTPSGWYVSGDGFREYSTEIDGRRVSFVDSPVYTYANAGPVSYDFGAVETAGSLVIRKDPRGLKIIPIAGTSQARFNGSKPGKVTEYTSDDRLLGEVDVEASDMSFVIKFRPDARYYIVSD